MPDEVMENEKIKDGDDIMLVSSLIVCVPLKLVCALATKLWRAKEAGLLAVESGPKAAFYRYIFGLASAQDRRELRQYLESLAAMHAETVAGSASTTQQLFRSTWAGTASTPLSSSAAIDDVSRRSSAVERNTNAIGLTSAKVEMRTLDKSNRSEVGSRE